MTVTNTAIPVVSGTAQQGQTLSTSNGSWTYDLDFLTYTYRWLRCDAAGANCVAIGGATNLTYLLTAADVGSTIRSEVTATENAAPPPPPPPPPGTLYFVGDFDTGDLSQWNDFHDAQLHRSPPGVQVVFHPDGGHMAKFTVIQAPDTSQWGDATVLWEGPPSYGLSYLQSGQTTWFRYQMLFPNNTDPDYPGTYTPTAGTIALIHEWHTNPSVATNAYSSFIGVTHEGSPHCIIFQTRGGPGEGEMHRFHQQNGGSSRIPLQYNHWYDIVNRITFGTTSGTGSIEWYIDGIHQGTHSVPTYPSAGGGLGHEIGLYRGPSHVGTDTLYIDGVRVGPTKASVEG